MVWYFEKGMASYGIHADGWRKGFISFVLEFPLAKQVLKQYKYLPNLFTRGESGMNTHIMNMFSKHLSPAIRT